MALTSELPRDILHDILSRLPTKTAAQTSVLSKHWLKACSTKPHLNFDESDFKGQHSRFCRFVDTTLARYLTENLPISSLKLSLSFSYGTDCDGLVNKWVDLLAEKRVSQLTLRVNRKGADGSERYYLLANSLFANMESLEQLELDHFRISVSQKAVSVDKIVQFRSLKSLSLRAVIVSDSVFHSLISCCPQLMTISLQYCSLVSGNRIHISNLPNLLSVHILCCGIEEVHIVDVPKMLSFGYLNQDKPGYLPSKSEVFLRSLNIGTCQNLRRVAFLKATIDDKVLSKLVETLPCINELMLGYCNYLKNISVSSSTLMDCSIDNCSGLEQVIFDAAELTSLNISKCENLINIKVSSSTLKDCSIGNCSGLVQAAFDVPNLLSLNIIKCNNLNLSSTSKFCSPLPSLSRCKISIDHGHEFEWTAPLFIILRRSLIELNDKVVDLTLSSMCFGRSFNIKTLIESGIDDTLIPQVENLTVCKVEKSYNYSTLFDIIFWVCRPKILTLLHCGNGFRQYLRKYLLNKSRLQQLKCTWKDYLMNSEIDYMKRTKDGWVSLDTDMFTANPHFLEEIDSIRFKQTQWCEFYVPWYVTKTLLERWI